jgi:hypothetical protein
MITNIALGLSRFAPIDNPATVAPHGEVLTAIFIIVALLIVILLVGFGVTIARRPGKAIDEWGNPTTPSTPPR